MKILRNVIYIILSVIILLLCIGAYVYSQYLDSSTSIVDRPEDIVIEKTDDITASVSGKDEVFIETPKPEETKMPIYKQEQISEEVVNILLLGMDARNYEEKSRSDSIILATYNTKTGDVKLTSFMRDSWVYIPTEKGMWSRINAATAIGGPGLLINTLNENFNLDIQNFVQVKFDDFIHIVDTLGGIDIDITANEAKYINKKLHSEDKIFNMDLPEESKVQKLNGKQSLWYCRNRSVGNSDYTRTERQRKFLETMLKQVKNQITIPQVANIVYTMKDYVNTNMNLDLIVKLGMNVLTQKDISMSSERIPFDSAYAPANKNGASVLELDIDKNTSLLHNFLYEKGET